MARASRVASGGDEWVAVAGRRRSRSRSGSVLGSSQIDGATLCWEERAIAGVCGSTWVGVGIFGGDGGCYFGVEDGGRVSKRLDS